MKHLKSVSFFSVLFLLVTSTSSGGIEVSPLLTSNDLKHEKEDRQRGPALSSALDDPKPWATYNQWMCFDSKQIELGTVDIKTGADWIPWPQITVATAGQHFYFSPETDLDLDSSEVVNRWKGLIAVSREICLYGAFLQYLDEDNNHVPDSLWVLEDFKTENGYWHVADATPVQATSQEKDN